MDKLKITYNGFLDENYTYELRIPDNLNWFVISRYLKEKNGYDDAEYVIYNGSEILFAAYSYIGGKKIKHLYPEEVEEEIKTEFAYDLIQRIGFNSLTLKILERLQFNVNHLKRKFSHLFLHNKKLKYTLNESISDNNDYESSYDILSNNSEKVLGKMYINNNKIKIDVKKDKIDILRLLKTKKYSEENKQSQLQLKKKIKR